MRSSHWPISVLSSISAVFNSALPIILVRVLTPTDMGFYKIFFLYAMLLPSFAMTSGLTSGLAYWAGRGDEGKKAIRMSGLMTLAAAATLFCVAFAFRDALTERFGWSPTYSAIFAFSVFGAISTAFFEEAAIATGRIWTGAIFLSGFDLARSLLVLATAFATRDLKAIFLVQACMMLLKSASGYAIGARLGIFGLELDRRLLGPIWKYAFPVSLAWMFGAFLNSGDQFVLSNLISPAEFALYTMGCLVVPPLLIIEQSVTRVMVPQLSEAFANNDHARGARLYKGAVNQMAFLFFPAAAGLAVFADPIIELLFTKQYADASGYLRLMAVSYLMLSIPYDAVARSRANGGWILRNFVFFSLLSLASCFLLARSFGAYGALSAVLSVRALMKLYATAYARKATGWRWSEFLPLQSIGRYAAVCLALSLAALLSRPVFGSELAWFLGAGLAFPALYFAILLPWQNVRGLDERMSTSDDGKPRVLMVSQYLGIGGLEKMILNLSQRLISTGRWHVSVFAYDQMDLEEDARYANLIREFRAAGCSVRTSKKKPGFSPGAVALLVREIYRSGAHVLHSHDLGSLIYAVCGKVLSLWRVRLVHTQHSFVHLGKKGRYRLYERFFTWFVDELTVVNGGLIEGYRELGIPPFKVTAVPNGVAFPDAPVATRKARLDLRKELASRLPAALASRLGAPSEELWAIYLARIHPVKGQKRAIALWSAIDPSIRARSRLLIIGPETIDTDGDELRDLIARAPDPDRIVLAGATREPRSWIQAADCYLSCSEFEGMPLGPLEALGSGTPVVVSRIPGHSFLEQSEGEGSGVRIFELGDPADGARKLGETLLGSRSLDGHALWERTAWVRRSFSLQAMSDRYEKLYRRALSRETGPAQATVPAVTHV